MDLLLLKGTRLIAPTALFHFQKSSCRDRHWPVPWGWSPAFYSESAGAHLHCKLSSPSELASKTGTITSILRAMAQTGSSLLQLSLGGLEAGGLLYVC